MPGKLLLDTSVIIEMLSGDAAAQQTAADTEQVKLMHRQHSSRRFGDPRGTPGRIGMAELEREIQERLSALTLAQQRRVLEYIGTLTGERPRGVPGHTLERFAGIWTKEEADEIQKAIDEQFERVEPYGR